MVRSVVDSEGNQVRRMEVRVLYINARVLVPGIGWMKIWQVHDYDFTLFLDFRHIRQSG